MKKVLALLAGIIFLISAGCTSTSDSGKTITEQAFPALFANVVDISQMASATYTGVGYQLRLNYTDLTADVVISGLRTPDGTAYPTISIKDIPWTIEKGAIIVAKGRNLTPEMSGFANVPLFSSFEMRLINRVANDKYIPGIVFSYTINNRFNVMSSYASQTMFATTVSKSTADNSEYKSVQTVYELDFNVETGRLKITMRNSNFASGMPAFDIVLENIPFTFAGTKARWSIDAITPKIGNDPFAAFPITDLSGELDFADDFELEFNCNPVTMSGSFEVEAEGSYTFVPEA